MPDVRQPHHVMRTFILSTLLGALLLATAAPALAAAPECRPAPKTEGCFIVHGRIGVSNGIGPNLWRIGTKRRYGLLLDEAAFPTLARFLTFHHFTFGNFLVCPQAADTPGGLRSVCIRGADALVVQHLDGPLKDQTFRPPCPECTPLSASQ